MDDADTATKKIWKKAGVNTDDENTIILYSYVSDSWPETIKILKKYNIDYKELEDPNSAGESFIVFVKESVVNEAKDFTPHKMYDPETGDEYEAEKPEDHERMAKLGYVHEKPESVDEARFVKDFNTRVLDAKTKEEVLKLYPNAEFFIGKSDHFFGELDANLFFKAYYTKGQKEFRIKSVYSEKNKNYVHLFNESLNEAAPRIKTSKEEASLLDLRDQVRYAQKGGSASRYAKDFEKAKKKALSALGDMITYIKIGV